MGVSYEDQAEKLYQAAKANHNIDLVYQNLKDFSKGIGGETAFLQLMLNEGIETASKHRFFKDIVQFFTKETQEFFNYFIERMEYTFVYRAIAHFESLYEKYHMVVTSAVPLSSEQVNRIVTAVIKNREQSIDTYEVIVDEKVIAGVRVQTAQWLIDTTLQTQLEQFKQTI